MSPGTIVITCGCGHPVIARSGEAAAAGADDHAQLCPLTLTVQNITEVRQ